MADDYIPGQAALQSTALDMAAQAFSTTMSIPSLSIGDDGNDGDDGNNGNNGNKSPVLSSSYKPAPVTPEVGVFPRPGRAASEGSSPSGIAWSPLTRRSYSLQMPPHSYHRPAAMATASFHAEHPFPTSSPSTTQGRPDGERRTIPQTALFSQQIASQAGRMIGSLQSHSDAAFPVSVKQSIKDEHYQSGEGDGAAGKLEEAEQERTTTSRSEGEIDTLDKYAFNHDRDAYDHQVPRHLTAGILVVVSRLDYKTPMAQHRDEAQKKGLADVCPPLVPHEHELQDGDPKAVRCIWVGMLPSQERADMYNVVNLQTPGHVSGEGSSKKPPKKKARLSASIADLTEDVMKIIPFDPNALRVVVKKADKPTKSWSLYALLNPNEDNLCQGFKVPFEKVYFFKQFRDDDANGLHARQLATRAKIKAYSFPALSAPHGEVSPATTSTSQSLQTPGSQATKKVHTPTKHRPASFLEKTGDVILDSMREEISRAKRRLKTTGQASVQKRMHGDGHSQTPEPTFEQLMADLERDGIDETDMDFEDFGDATSPGKAGDEEAYPEHAVAATDAEYIEYEKRMIDRVLHSHDETGLDRSGIKHSAKIKDKPVTFKTNNGKVVSNRNHAAQPRSRSSLHGDGYAGDDEQEEDSQMQPETIHLARRMIEMATELAAQGDIGVLRQGCTLLNCLKNRSAPPKTGALGLYLNVPTDGSSDPSDCSPKLDELLELFPDLDEDDRVDDHILAWMSRALQITGQSIDIELVRPCLVAFGEQFASRFGETARQRVPKDDLVDMICLARDEAEQMMQVGALTGGGKRGAGPSRPEVEEEAASWTPRVWARKTELR